MINIEHMHRQLIHFPIALLTMSLLFDLAGHFLKKEQLISTGWNTLLTGVIASVVAILSGFVADRVYGHMLNPFPVFKTHGMIQLIASVIFIGLCAWRYSQGPKHYKPPAWYLIASALAVFLLLYGAHIGGTLAGHV